MSPAPSPAGGTVSVRQLSGLARTGKLTDLQEVMIDLAEKFDARKGR